MNDVKYKFEIGPIESKYLGYVEQICKKTLASNENANSIYIYARHAIEKIEKKIPLDLIETQSFFDVIGQFYQATKAANKNGLASEHDLAVAKDLMRFALRMEAQIPKTKQFNFGPVS